MRVPVLESDPPPKKKILLGVLIFLFASRAGLWSVNSHSFFAYPDPAVFLKKDPDPTASKMQIRMQLNKI